MRELRGRTALVTGAASGLGRAIASALAAEGMRLWLVDRDAAGLATTAAALGADVQTEVLDVTDPTGWEALAARLHEVAGPLALLVHAAGLTVHGPFERHSEDEVRRVLDVDLVGPILGTRAFLPQLQAAGDAHVVLVSSLAALFGVPMQATYSAAKAGLRSFGAALRIEQAPRGVGVTTVMPGTIATPFLAHAGSHHDGTRGWMADAMLRHGMRPEAVARRIVRAVRRDRAELVLGWEAHGVAFVQRFFPGLLPCLLDIAWRFTRPDREVAR